jgi:site-specific recombinase XerD
MEVIMLKGYMNHLKNKELSCRTLLRYSTDIKQFFEWLGHEDVKNITKDDMIEYKKHLQGKFKTNSVNIKIISINKFLEYMGVEGLHLKQDKQQRKSTLENVLSVKDYERLLRMAQTKGKTKMYYLMQVLANTGIRISELEFITVEAIKMGHTEVNNKGKKRKIIIPSKLCKDLKKYCQKEAITKGIIFRGRTEKLIDKSYIYRELQYISGQARVRKDKAHAHSFRHLYAKQFLNKHDDITLLADLLGHSSLETTRIYTKRSTSEQKEIMNKINLYD